jgi:acyl carrier protein
MAQSHSTAGTHTLGVPDRARTWHSNFKGEQKMEKTKEMIRKYIANNILFTDNGYSYPDDASFLGEGIVDSMNVLELVMFVEQNFGMKVDDQEIIPDNFDSVTKLATFVQNKINRPTNRAGSAGK